jgi:hypothetical protein
MTHRNKSFYDYRGFTGPDRDIEISLRDYGLLWKKVKKDEYLFVYGIAMNEKNDYVKFTYSFLTVKDWRDMINETWFNARAVCAYAGYTVQEFIADFPFTVQSAISFHGTENIFGTNYDEGYTIGGNE